VLTAPAGSEAADHTSIELKIAPEMVADNGAFEFESIRSTHGKETADTFDPNQMKSVAKWEGDTLVIQTKGSFGDNEVVIGDK
jgi:hypothetical protein